MNLNDLRARSAIVGVGTAVCGEAHGFNDIEILALAAKAAVEDAGLKMSDIDGLCTANLGSALWPLNVVEYLNLRPSFIEGTNIGGSAFVAQLLPAMLALEAGQCKHVLVCYGSTQRTDHASTSSGNHGTPLGTGTGWSRETPANAASVLAATSAYASSTPARVSSSRRRKPSA